MNDNFHSVAKYRWSETIYKEILNFVKDDFDFEVGN